MGSPTPPSGPSRVPGGDPTARSASPMSCEKPHHLGQAAIPLGTLPSLSGTPHTVPGAPSSWPAHLSSQLGVEVGLGGCQEPWDPAALRAPSLHRCPGAQGRSRTLTRAGCAPSHTVVRVAAGGQGVLPGADLDHSRVGALDRGRVEAREEGAVADGVALGEHEGLGAAVGQLWVQPPDLQQVVGKGSAPAREPSLGQRAEPSWRPEPQADGPAPPGSHPSGTLAHHCPQPAQASSALPLTPPSILMSPGRADGGRGPPQPNCSHFVGSRICPPHSLCWDNVVAEANWTGLQ